MASFKKKIYLRILDLLGSLPPFQNGYAINLCLSGKGLSDQQVEELEGRLVKEPGNLRLRLLLLGKYWSDNIVNEESRRKRLNHIKYIVSHHSDHAVAGLPYASAHKEDEDYESVKVLWLRQIELKPNHIKVLTNAAHFFLHHDKELAEQCLLKALKKKPAAQETRKQLALLYSLWDGHEEDAYCQSEKLLKGSRGEDLFYSLTNFTELAFAAGDYQRAGEAARELLALSEKYRDNWNYGNAVNGAHTVLGRIALKENDVEAAARHLRQSAIDIASPQTKSFGPSLDLAKELAQAGDKINVLAYLDSFERLCGVTNNWAYELRFEVETGEKLDSLNREQRERLQKAELDHQYNFLSSSREWRDKFLEKTIRSTSSSIAIFSRGDEKRAEPSVRVQLLKAHLERLKQLSAEGSKSP